MGNNQTQTNNTNNVNKVNSSYSGVKNSVQQPIVNHTSQDYTNHNIPKMGEEYVKNNVIIPNQVNINNNINYNIQKPKRQYIGRVTTNDLISSFNANCIDNFYLNREKFNLAIKKLLYHLNLPTLACTHLVDKLYDIVDESGDGRISLDEFVGGMSKVLSDPEFSKKCKKIFIKK
jgi:hypothetical protein